MKTIKNIALFVVAVSAVFMHSACNSCQNSKTKDADFENNIDSVDYQDEDKKSSTVYKIPCPMELFIFIEGNDVEYHSELLPDPAKCEQYIDNYSRSLNFGISAADLAYATVYGNNQDAISYFASTKSLATKLGLYEGFGKEIVSRLDGNLMNFDSLVVIANDSYYSSIEALEEQGMTDMLGLILTGGWIEGVFILTQSAKNQDITSPVSELIADQHLLLENLIEYLSRHEDSDNLVKVRDSLNELLQVYDKLYMNKDGVRITREQYVEITNKVSEIRNHFVFEI